MEMVHLSDLHYAANDAFQTELIRALLADLAERRDKGSHPEFLVFSGDLVKNPDDANGLRPSTETLHLSDSFGFVLSDGC
jgi:predicted MPP superfamily phosphohydrolase